MNYFPKSTNTWTRILTRITDQLFYIWSVIIIIISLKSSLDIFNIYLTFSYVFVKSVLIPDVAYMCVSCWIILCKSLHTQANYSIFYFNRCIRLFNVLFVDLSNDCYKTHVNTRLFLINLMHN